MNNGYVQLELEEESRKLTTFYTPKGLKRTLQSTARQRSLMRRFTRYWHRNLVPSASTMTSLFME